MPETVYHLRKAEHNKATAAHLKFSGTTYQDWAVTIRFYAAMHLVDALLDQMPDLPKDERHPRKHHAAANIHGNGGRGRNQLVNAILTPVRKEYSSLYDASRRSRYDMDMLGDDIYEKLGDQLDKIETYVRMQLMAHKYTPVA
jgi:hypothetical protein